MRPEGGSKAGAVPASIGAAQLLGSEPSIDPLMHRADQALYAAKHGGRNRVVAASWLDEAALNETASASVTPGADAVPAGLTLQAETE